MKFTLPDPTKDYILTTSVFIDSTANEFRTYGLHSFIDENICYVGRPYNSVLPNLKLGPFCSGILDNTDMQHNICFFADKSIDQEIKDARKTISHTGPGLYATNIAQSAFDIMERRCSEISLSGKYEIPKGTLLQITKIAWFSRKVSRWSNIVSAMITLPDGKKGRLTIPMELFSTMDFDVVDKIIPKGTKTKKTPKSSLTI